MNSTALSGRQALVTGAARGIGCAIAAGLIARGARVLMTDKDGLQLTAAAASLNTLSMVLDVREPGHFDAAAETLRTHAGRLDILVNNAGVLTAGAFDSTSADDWNELLSVNVSSLFHAAHSLVPLMHAGACIVNVASVSAQRGGGAVGNLWYGATKAAVVAITTGMARELGPRGIRVNAVAPGLVDTSLTHDLLTPSTLARVMPRFPLGRLAAIDDIARVVCALCSEDAAFVSGALVPVDGAFLCT